MSFEIKPEWLLEMAAKEEQCDSVQVGNIRDALLKLKAQEDAKRDADLAAAREELSCCDERARRAESDSERRAKERDKLQEELATLRERLASAEGLAKAAEGILDLIPDRNDALNYAATNEGRTDSIHVSALRFRQALAAWRKGT